MQDLRETKFAIDATRPGYGVEKTAQDAAERLPRKGNGADRPEIFSVIDPRRLERECFIRSVELLHPRLVFVGYATVEECIAAAGAAARPSAILLTVGGRKVGDNRISADLRRLVEEMAPSPVVVLTETEDLEQMVAVLECGANGCIPATVGVDAIVEASRLASSGGIFLSADGAAALRRSMGSHKPQPPMDFGEQLTSRQASVAEALRRGKANKIIAYELNMCESTVKVHIRNILKKLNASNRTEAAFKLNAIQIAQEAARQNG